MAKTIQSMPPWTKWGTSKPAIPTGGTIAKGLYSTMTQCSLLTVPQYGRLYGPILVNKMGPINYCPASCPLDVEW